jgi:hypothetical protein
MTNEDLGQLIEKYRNLSMEYEPEDEEASIAYERFAEFMIDYTTYTRLSEDDDEMSLWENFKEAEAGVGNYWDVAFPEDDDDDSITDYLTKS